MKQLVVLILILLIYGFSSAQNVGIGTQTPKARFSIGGNSQFQVDGLGDIRRINDIPYSFPVIQGVSGQVLMNDGTGQLNWGSVDVIITITPTNYSSIKVQPGNYVKINGEIVLASKYQGLEEDKLVIVGGAFIGNGNSPLHFGRSTLIQGVTFTDIDIDASDPVFINCSFNGNCPNLGYDGRFYNCKFNGVTVTSVKNIYSIQSSELNNCIIPRITSLIDCNIDDCTIGTNNLNTVSSSSLDNSTVYAVGGTFTFTNNRCNETKVSVGNAEDCPSSTLISDNHFDDIIDGGNSIIEIDPSDNSVKFIKIQNNIFRLDSSDPQSVAVTADDGYVSRSRLLISGNSFYQGDRTLSYASNLTTIYTLNVESRSAHPDDTGDLTVENNY